jgi:hypothetical protein
MNMSLRCCRLIPVLLLLAAPVFAADTPPQFVPMSEGLLMCILAATYVLVLLSIRWLATSLSKDNAWSMGKALSENTIEEQADQQNPGKTVMAPMPSSSRLIAFLGMIVLLATFLAFGTTMIWALGRTGKVPDMENAQGFLLAGMSMFAPYLISQSREAVKALGGNPGPPAPPAATTKQPTVQPSAPGVEEQAHAN